MGGPIIKTKLKQSPHRPSAKVNGRSLSELLRDLASSAGGLSSNDAAVRLQKIGKNDLVLSCLRTKLAAFTRSALNRFSLRRVVFPDRLVPRIAGHSYSGFVCHPHRWPTLAQSTKSSTDYNHGFSRCDWDGAALHTDCDCTGIPAIADWVFRLSGRCACGLFRNRRTY